MSLQSNTHLKKNDKCNFQLLNKNIIWDKNIIVNDLFVSIIEKFPCNKPYGHIFQNKNNCYKFTIMANHKFGLPYGIVPRLIFLSLIEVTNETKSPILNIDKIYSKLLHTLKVMNNSNNVNICNNLYNQILKFFTSYISYNYISDYNNDFCSFDFWQIPLKISKDKKLPSIVLTNDFYNVLIKLSNLTNTHLFQSYWQSSIQNEIHMKRDVFDPDIL